MDETTVEPGAVVVGNRYELLSLLGTGAMGVVYRVRDRELDENVALKLLRRELVSDDESVARMRTEVKLARRVTHLNVARTFDIGKHGDDVFLTMEFIEGDSLDALLSREGPLPIELVVDVAAQICAGLGAAHAVDVVHRDLKPANVMRARSGRIAITDFGIACLRAEALPSDLPSEFVVGTPAFMSPEQLLGDSSLDGRADIFALGAVLFKLLTNERPFPNVRSLEDLLARANGPPADPRRLRPDTPSELAAVVMRCLASDRTARFSDVEAVADALAAAPASRVVQSSVRAPLTIMPALQRRPGVRVVAVVPFRNAGAPTDAYLAEGFTHDLVDALGCTRSLDVRVVAAMEPGEARHDGARILALARELGADAVVEGSLFRIAESVRVTARVLAVENDLQLWGARMTRPFAELLAVGDEITASISAALTAARDAPLRPSADPVAVDLYLRARALYHADSRETMEAPALFERALQHAPDDPTILACYALALARGAGPFHLRDLAADHARARAAAEHAVFVAPHLPEAHLALARIRYDEAELAAAARSLDRALQISPRNAEAFWLWGWMHGEYGDLTFAIARLRDALDLDPRMTSIQRDLMRAQALLGNWRVVDGVSAIEPPAAFHYGRVTYRLRLLAWRRDVDAVRAIAENAAARGFPGFDETVATILAGRVTPGLAGLLEASSVAARGVPRRASFSHQLSCEYRAFSHEESGTLDELEAADAARLFDLNWLDLCPLLDDVRDEPRFRAVRARVAERAAIGLAALHELGR